MSSQDCSSTRSRRAVALVGVLALLIVMAFGGVARADVISNTDFAPSIWSGKTVYGPGDEVLLNGANWQPGESVHVVVNDDQGSSWSRSGDVTADAAGNVTDSFNLPDWFVAHYAVTATGASGAVATAGFDDDAITISFPATGSSYSSSTWPATAVSGSTNGGNTASAKLSVKGPSGDYWSGTAFSGRTESDRLQPLTLVSSPSKDGNTKSWSYPFPAANHTASGSYVVTVHSYDNHGTELTTSTSTYTWGVACIAPSVTTPPADASVTYGADATFTVAAGGTAPAVQWQRSTDGQAWTNLTGETALSLNVAKPSASQNGDSYRAVVSNSCGTATSAAAKLGVAKQQITGAFTAGGRDYDGTADASITGRSVTGALVGDAVNLTGGSAAFADKNAGTGKTVTGTGFSLTGTAAANYALASTTLSTKADITKKGIDGSFTAVDRQYDGTTAATVRTRSLDGAIAGDAVDLSGGTASFATAAVGPDKTVTLTGAALTGADAGNYELTRVATATASISKRDVGGAFTAADKTYDGSTDADVLSRSVTDKVGDENVSLSDGTASFATAAVGPDKTVTLTGATLTGTDAGNYNLAGVATTTASITAKQITGSFTTKTKAYDGTADAEVLSRSVTDKIGDEDVFLSGGAASFDSDDAGTGRVVTLTGAVLGGADKGNYTLGSVQTERADITPKELTGSFSAQDKVYDGTATATIVAESRNLSGVVGSDDVTLTGVDAQFATAAAGTDRTATLNDAALAGDDRGNYTLQTPVTATAAITPKDVTGSFKADDKVYDGDVSAHVGDRSVPGVIGEDDVALSGGTATFQTKTVGTAKTVTLTGATLTGTAADNYHLTAVDDAKASIATRPVTGTWGAADKTYDGTVTATITGRTVNGKVAGDAVMLSDGAATFATKDVGTGKTVTGTGFALSGADAGNYALTSVNPIATAGITAKTVTGLITVADKVFDTTTAATVTTRRVGGSVAGDEVTLTGGTAAFDSALAGVRTATLTGAVLGGADKGNYVLGAAPITATATISPWSFKGFYAPIDMKATTGSWIYNTAKAGSAVPVKFSLGGDKGLGVFAAGFPKTTTVTCPNAPATDQLEELAAGTTSGLKYDATSDQYNYTWKTATTLAGKCVRLDVQFIDGQSQQAYFSFTK